ncbi:MAG: DAK2 domain-containing protein [Lachnospiraceae bacterium]|nr:DAK2 domain-containing protein [Lachnospiraceae bacterium]
MSANVISAELLAKMFLAGAKYLENKKEYVNELNVFPVPDGDTGTNMTLTILSAAKELNALTETNMASVCKAVSGGSLRGARGNSGVILSQLIRGFTKIASNYDELTIEILDEAAQKAVKTAYKAVMSPKEGTILTVASGIGRKAEELHAAGCDDLDVYLKSILDEAERVLATTPDLLPVLKEAGVVDSGGQGLVEILRGAYDAFNGKEIDLTFGTGSGKKKEKEAVKEELKYAYSEEFNLVLDRNFNIKNEMDFKDYLESIGDCVNVNTENEVVTVSLNTNDPGLPLQKGLKYGDLNKIRITNLKLKEEAQSASAPAEIAKPKGPKKKYGFIAVSVGQGINEIFTSLGVDFIISGGQTMNPSTEDMLNAIENVNADTIFILPNNKNIIMAANQARDLTKDKQIIVIPTKTIPQGITAVISFMEDAEAADNESGMNDGICAVKTGQVTYAVRDTVIDNHEIHQDDFMGIGDHGILSVGTDRDVVTLDMIKELADEDTELISVYYGEDVSEKEAGLLRASLEEAFPTTDIEVQYGGQPVYYYIVSVE